MSSSGDLRLTLLTKAGRVASVMDAAWRSEPCIAAMECTRSSRLWACRSSQQTRQRAACCLAISKSVVWYLGQAQG